MLQSKFQEAVEDLDTDDYIIVQYVQKIVEYYELYLNHKDPLNPETQDAITNLLEYCRKDLTAWLKRHGESDDYIYDMLEILRERVMEEIQNSFEKFDTEYLTEKQFYEYFMKDIAQ